MPSRPEERIAYEHHAGAVCDPLLPVYRRREPERTLLYAVVRDHFQTFLATRRESNPECAGLPSHVEREFERYLECGILAHGFVRVRCDACGDDRLVAFSCRGRAICPSCNARRMHDTAAHLVERVLPPGATYRQWVLSLPRWVRFRLAYRPVLVSQVLQLFVRAIFACQRRRARGRGIRDGQPGSVTFIQRFGSALNLNVHFHVLLPDGVFSAHGGEVSFVALEPPTDEEVEAVARKVARRTRTLLERVDESSVTGAEDAALLEAAAFEEARPRVAHFRIDEYRAPRKRRAVNLQGFSVHANVAVGEGKRDALERLCRYGARPPIALGRMSSTTEGRIAYRVKHHAPGEAGVLVLTPLELLGKLAALVPPPRVHGVRYHGVFAPNAKWRARVVPSGVPAPAERANEVDSHAGRLPIVPWTPLRPRRLDWAALLQRVFKLDALECDRCGGRRRVLAFVTDRRVARAILARLGLPTDAPVMRPARAPPLHDRKRKTDAREEEGIDPPPSDEV